MKRTVTNLLGEGLLSKRFLFGFGKKNTKATTRPGAMAPEEVEKVIRKHGISKKVRVSLVDYAGNVIDETPVIITSIMEDHFSGKVVNVERQILEQSSSTSVYVKGGGGTVDFFYADGDIASIEEDADNEIIESMDNTEVLEVLTALETGDEILVSFYDKSSGGVINGMGSLGKKNIKSKTFSVTLNRVNEIDQDPAVVKELNLEKDTIIALQII